MCHLQYTQFINQRELEWVVLWDVATVLLGIDVDFMFPPCFSIISVIVIKHSDLRTLMGGKSSVYRL